MFLDDKPQGEVTEAPARTLKLSEAIRKGLPIVKEDRANWRGCALGAAFAGVHGRQMTVSESDHFIGDVYVRGLCRATSHAIADALGFSRDLCQQVNLKHHIGMSAARIADWLEAQGL